MSFQKKNQSTDQYTKTKVALLRQISAQLQAGGSKLPPEEELCRQLGVSRVVLRDVLAAFESRGYITRRRGVGTSINTQVFGMQSRIDEQIDFHELIRSKGYASTFSLLRDDYREEAPGVTDELFCPKKGERLLRLERIFSGDGRAMIYNLVYIKESIIELDYKKWKGYEELSVFEFLELFCSKPASMTLSELTLVRADATLAEKLSIAPEEPLMLMRDTGYTGEQEAIVRAYSYMLPTVLPLKLVRRKI